MCRRDGARGVRVAVEAGANQRAVMGGQAVCICECVRA